MKTALFYHNLLVPVINRAFFYLFPALCPQISCFLSSVCHIKSIKCPRTIKKEKTCIKAVILLCLLTCTIYFCQKKVQKSWRRTKLVSSTVIFIHCVCVTWFRPTVLWGKDDKSPGRDHDAQLAWQEIPTRSKLLLAYHCGAQYGWRHTYSQHASITHSTRKETRYHVTFLFRFGYQVIQVKFDKFLLEADSYCRFDYVAFFNGGEKDDSRLIGKYCGDEAPQ